LGQGQVSIGSSHRMWMYTSHMSHVSSECIQVILILFNIVCV
jgi:hypothetical protein